MRKRQVPHGVRGGHVHQLDLSVWGPLGMTSMALGSVARQLGSLFEDGSAAGLSDRQLLERFTARGGPADEAAFAVMVARHGPMVLGVCRQLLGDHHHAEDAFQAVFLVLARQARSIRDPELLGTWLYGVALRTARTSRGRIARRRRTEQRGAARQSTAGPGLAADRAMLEREQAEALHREIERLPSTFRVPVVLCYFEGLTLDEAAQRLRRPVGTVRSRLARARVKLRRGLTRRGIVLPAAALVAMLDARPVSAALSSLLCDITTRSAVGFAAKSAAAGTISAPAMALAQDVLRSMLLHKLKLAILTLSFLGAIASAAGFVGQAPARQVGKPDPGQPAANPDELNLKPAPGRMFVLGRVLDPAGKPVPNATTMVYARSKALGHSPSISRMSPVPIGDTRADGSGQFHLDAPRTSSSRFDTFGAVAIAPGYGAGWAELDPDADQPDADITLRPEHVIHGRLFDVQGRPVSGVTISVWLMRHALPRAPAVARGRFEGITYWWTNANDFPAWPTPAMTDAEGRFTLRGVGQNLRVYLTAHHPRFALQRIEVETDGTSESRPITMALAPPKVITGHVTYTDTGKSVPHALIGVISEGTGRSVQSDFETDAEGRFRINAPSGDAYVVSAWPPAGLPYLAVHQRLNWPKGAIERSLDLALPRGVSIHGKVTEEGSGEPIAAATVRFISQAERQGNAASSSGSTVLDTAADGSFQFGALPSPGYLTIMAPSDDYVLQPIGSRMIQDGQPGGRRYYSHVNVLLELKPGIASKKVEVGLRRGATAKGQVVGPDRQPARDAWIISRIIMQPTPGTWKSWYGDHHDNTRGGRFELHGLAPDGEVPVHFLDPNRKLGATAIFSGKSAASGPVVIRLEPCGSAKARLVNPNGQPVAGPLPRRSITMVVTPGPPDTPANEQAGLLAADEAELNQIDPTNHEIPLASDADGRITLPVLIPGATYRFIDRTTTRDPIGPQVRKEFSVKPGEILDLGDILIERPQH
jgi:RNA polymerase sigma factor (sigma-70 family)